MVYSIRNIAVVIFGARAIYLDRSIMHPKFDLTGVQTHGLQIMIHFMVLRLLPLPLSRRKFVWNGGMVPGGFNMWEHVTQWIGH